PTVYTNQVAYQQEEIFVRIENNIGTQCYSTDSFLFDVFDSALPNDVTYRLCDNADDGDDMNGFVEFDLSTISAQVIDPQSTAQFNISYHANQADAIANASPLPLLYTNSIANSEQVVVRMENIDNTNCYTTALIDLIVDPLPNVTPIVELRQCDDDADGLTLFNLTEANDLISTNGANEVFTYYLTQTEAQGGAVVDQIANVNAYQNPVPLAGVVFARIESDQGCWRTAQIDLIVGATQIPAGFQLSYNACDDVSIDGDNTNGIASFDFIDATAQIEALFPVGQNITISYYTSITDALSETNSIPDISDHRNDLSPNVQNIVVRVDSDDVNACLGLGEHIALTVDPLPTENTITDFVLCSDTNEAQFDLMSKDNEVIGTHAGGMIVSYHRSLSDALANNNALVSPFTNESINQTIYVRAQFDDNANGIGDVGECLSTDMSFQLQVIPNPVIFSPDAIRICSDQIDTVYDLTIRESQISGGDGTIVLDYYETQLDLDNDNPIPDISNYTSTSLNNTIIVEATGTNGCTSTTTLELNTILYALTDLMPNILEECEIDNDGFDEFDLTRRENQILNGLNPADFVFSYYVMETDAIAGNANTIDDPGAYINSIALTETIFVRIDPISNECFQIAPLTLQVNQVPEILIEDEYVICLDRDDNVLVPENITFLPNPPIDTQLNETEYSFEWYLGDVSSDNLLIGENASTLIPIVPGDYTVIATNLLTGCTIPASTTVIGSYPPESISVEVITPAFSENNAININVEGIGDYEYSLDDGLWQDSSVFENILGGEHTVYVRDTLNCGQVFSIFIVIDYPKFVTPNGDGYNDTWNIKGIKNQPNAKIYIFDRYGKLLKQLNSASNGWDGTFNGEMMPSSDYWFTVEFIDPIDDVMKIFKAHFALKR
ncbi:MAG: T9SS type B sorting domain-containing protein, partial [Flavobacteriaceae bacterium]|nr:T9SS type B sorting domain-containing protein [Flavobacteriaceae bacterium]